MIKRILMSGAVLLSMTAAYGNTQRGGNDVTLSEVEYSVDTLFHAKVGPGTTQTSLRLTNKNSAGQDLRVFYLTTDLTNPNVQIKALVGNDKLSGGATVSSMAKSHSSATENYFGGINTDFFYTSGSATNGTSLVGTPTRGSIVDGEIYRTSGASTAFPNFYVDEAGAAHIGAVSFSGGTATIGDKSATFSVVNNGAADNAISVYTPKYYGILNQPNLAGACAEVPAKMIEGDFIGAGKTVKLEVTGEPTTTGDRTIPAGEYMLPGRGTAVDFVKNLKTGDVVTLEAKATVDGTAVFPTQLCAGNPWILKNGETLDSEGDRGDASSLHPRSGIGFDNEKKNLVMMVIDGRNAISVGVHTKQLADMMYYAGADNAMNVDGGGSSTLYTGAFGVRNNPSDGKERAVASGMFVAAEVSEDTEIAEIRFVDWSMKFPKYGIYTPKFYGYNKYGIVVSTDVEGVTLSCDATIGEVTNEGKTFYGTGNGIGALKATYNGLEATIPVVVETSDNVALRLQNVVIDGSREYPVEVQALVNEDYMPMSPTALSWISSDPEVATIGASDGVLKGVKEGETTVTGTLGDFTGTLNVKVEIPTSEVMPVVEAVSATEWKLSQLGGTGISISGLDKGFALNYTGNGSGRGAYITAERTSRIWSLPEKIRIRINPGISSVTKLSLNISNALGANEPSWAICGTELPKEQESVIEASLSDIFDTSDIGIYPITINSIRFDMNKSEKGKEFEIQVPGFEAVYSAGSGIGSLPAANAARIYPNPVVSGAAVTVESDGAAAVELYTLGGVLMNRISIAGTATIATDNLSKGMYVVKVSDNDSVKIAKLIVK